MAGSDTVTAARVRLERQAEGVLLVTIAGHLNANALPTIWGEPREAILQKRPSRIEVNAAEVAYCDGAGMAFFLELRRLAATLNCPIEFRGMSGDLEQMFRASTLSDPLAGQLAPLRPPNLPTRTGACVVGVLLEMADIVTFLGELVLAGVLAIRHPGKIRGKDFLLTAEKVGVNALPVVCLLGGLIGLIMAFQTATPMERYGGTSLIPMIVGIAMARELGPLITAIIVAGRSGSAFAAEIGTMKVTEELDALRTFGLEPVRFLAVPRVLAAIAMLPLLAVFGTLVGIVAGYPVMRGYGYAFDYYVNAITQSVDVSDFAGGIAKTLVFGFIIGGTGCMRGMRTRTGPSAVGDSTTKAVVASIVLIIAADMIFGVVYYYLGI